MADDVKMKNYMENVISTYDKMRGKHRHEFHEEFWDAVVLSSSDNSQKVAYEKQITRKLQCHHLPLDIPFHVFSDPPDCKIGCGGSTMLILEKISEIYGNELLNMRILFIPAGGYSQRLPNHSVLGKLFAPVPIRNSRYEMIDLICAVYLPFLKRMKSGVFLACSDAIISYCLAEEDDWSFNGYGFTALAHPSSIAIAQNHGVYVLSQPNLKKNTFMSSCLQVLQKPSESLMEQKGALVKDTEKENKTTVFTDSAFFFDMDVAMKLIHFFKENKPFHCELSSYGDFLQPLGAASDRNYIQTDISELSNLKGQLYDLLHETPLHVIVLKRSTFYHFGTMKEYCYNFSMNSHFYNYFPCETLVYSVLKDEGGSSKSIKGTILHSVLHSTSVVNQNSIIEYCDFDIPVHVSSSCIISNCIFSSNSLLGQPLVIPANLLIHTIPLNQGYVTICFSMDDDIKKCCAVNEGSNLFYFHMKLKNIPHLMLSNMFSASENELVSLWHAKLFPICDSMQKSFLCTLSIVYEILGSSNSPVLVDSSRYKFISMNEALKYKNEEKLMIYREKILSKITDSLNV